ncbi:MAG: hypothetical protein HWD59_10575 [Coxiellaceae bacterium]|nr:MAG: hypothetical protein HWD59_10575 [Coxiellaceae bacterium]
MRQDLPKEAQPHYHLIADFMIRRVLQRGHIRQEPDVLVEVEPLLRNALKGVIRIVEAFGRDRARYRNSQPIPIMLSDTLYYQEMPQDIQSQIFKLEEHGKQYIETLDQQNITLAFMQDCNRWLQALTKHYRLNQQPKLAGDLYVLIAQKLPNNFPGWLGVIIAKQCANIVFYLASKMPYTIYISYRQNYTRNCHYSDLHLLITDKR